MLDVSLLREKGRFIDIPGRFWRPETLAICSRREVPSALSLASRRSRRRRACFCVGVSAASLLCGGVSMAMDLASS